MNVGKERASKRLPAEFRLAPYFFYRSVRDEFIARHARSYLANSMRITSDSVIIDAPQYNMYEVAKYHAPVRFDQSRSYADDLDEVGSIAMALVRAGTKWGTAVTAENTNPVKTVVRKKRIKKLVRHSVRYDYHHIGEPEDSIIGYRTTGKSDPKRRYYTKVTETPRYRYETVTERIDKSVPMVWKKMHFGNFKDYVLHSVLKAIDRVEKASNLTFEEIHVFMGK